MDHSKSDVLGGTARVVHNLGDVLHEAGRDNRRTRKKGVGASAATCGQSSISLAGGGGGGGGGGGACSPRPCHPAESPRLLANGWGQKSWAGHSAQSVPISNVYFGDAPIAETERAGLLSASRAMRTPAARPAGNQGRPATARSSIHPSDKPVAQAHGVSVISAACTDRTKPVMMLSGGASPRPRPPSQGKASICLADSPAPGGESVAVIPRPRPPSQGMSSICLTDAPAPGGESIAVMSAACTDSTKPIMRLSSGASPRLRPPSQGKSSICLASSSAAGGESVAVMSAGIKEWTKPVFKLGGTSPPHPQTESVIHFGDYPVVENQPAAPIFSAACVDRAKPLWKLRGTSSPSSPPPAKSPVHVGGAVPGAQAAHATSAACKDRTKPPLHLSHWRGAGGQASPRMAACKSAGIAPVTSAARKDRVKPAIQANSTCFSPPDRRA